AHTPTPHPRRPDADNRSVCLAQRVAGPTVDRATTLAIANRQTEPDAAWVAGSGRVRLSRRQGHGQRERMAFRPARSHPPRVDRWRHDLADRAARAAALGI